MENPFSILGKDITTYFSSVPFTISMITKRCIKVNPKLVEHSHKWHCEENYITTPDPLRIITEKLKLLNHEMEELIVDFRKLNTDDDRRSYYAEELPTHYSATLQNKFPLKEIDPGSFILPCIIGNHSISNALADLGESISVMPYSLFKTLGLRSLKSIKITIEMADRSIQSPKGIKENVLVKISNFVFPVDFVVLDIMEDENVPIILGRPMLATAHARIDVYGKKISLGVRNDQVVFNINKKESSAFISPICVINELDKMQELDDLVMDDEKAGNFENYLSPEYGSQDVISLLPSELAEDKEDFSMTLYDPEKKMSIGLEEFVDIDYMWDDLDPGILSNKKAKTKFLKKWW
ncbi:putative reverse transcriptase, RNA-dependent DNA polymerase [Tanacetum coccineum]